MYNVVITSHRIQKMTFLSNIQMLGSQSNEFDRYLVSGGSIIDSHAA